jgi:hypothetical protein
MAARPNALRTLEYGKRLAENQIKRLDEMVKITTAVLNENKTLTGSDIAGYKACIAAANKQLTQYRKLDELQLPVIAEPSPRKRGRPSQSDLQATAATRGKKFAAAFAEATKKALAHPSVISRIVTPVDGAPKKRGRKSKAEIAAIEALAAAALAAATPAPKKRGRPAKVKTEAITAAPAKRRGRPPGSKNKSTVAETDSDETVEMVQSETDAPKRAPRKPKPAAPEINVAPIGEDGEPIKRGPGRPKGSKNIPKLLNGQHAEIIAVS